LSPNIKILALLYMKCVVLSPVNNVDIVRHLPIKRTASDFGEVRIAAIRFGIREEIINRLLILDGRKDSVDHR
jgi:hypothetical protein